MTKQPRYWCVVPAAGVGKRMGAAIPKQYLPLNNSTVIQQTLSTLSKVMSLEAIVVCLSEEDEWWPSLVFQSSIPIKVAPGGEERSDSVLSGLNALLGQADENDWVLVHDVARPCVRVEDIERLIAQASEHSVGGLLGMPVRDTMKRANAQSSVVETVCRDNLWHALTPQMFRYGELKSALVSARQRGKVITDEASAMELLFHKQPEKQPLLVEGHPDNIKITHPEDLALAELFLAAQLKNNVEQEKTS